MKLKDAVRTLLYKDKMQKMHQLYTIWGENLDPEKVLVEYPRPQLKRKNYTILNGYWNYSITKSLERPAEFDGKILVPFSPESILSGVNKQVKPEDFLWYERSLEIKKIYPDMRCILHFGAVDQSCEVFINHNKVSEHTGGYLPFSIDITKQINQGLNLLTIRVSDLSETSYHSRGKQMLNRGGISYTAQSGIWQTVWMEWVPQYYIKSLKMTPLFDQDMISIEVLMNEYKFEDSKKICKVEIYDESHKLLQTMISRIPIINIPMKNIICWTPENPYLYHVTVTVGHDKIESYFAMRKFEVKKDTKGITRIFLNNQPYFQNGLLDQGYWPDGLYTPPSDEAMIFDIQSAKELGFNMLRKHIKIEPLRWYYHCDRLGVIVWQDMVNGGERYNQLIVAHLPTVFPSFGSCLKDNRYRLLARKSEEGRKEWTSECIETVKHLYNCPSIAVWVPFNEGWGQFDSGKAVDIIRQLDQTRLIDHASGWFDQKKGDFKSIHNYFHKLKVKTEQRAVVFSEFGGYACYIPDHTYSWQVFGYRIFLTKEDFNEAFLKLYREEINQLIPKGLSAAVYTQLSDVEDEINGLFTYDRKVCKVSKLTQVFSKPSPNY